MPRLKCTNPKPKRERVQPFNITEGRCLHRLRQKEQKLRCSGGRPARPEWFRNKRPTESSGKFVGEGSSPTISHERYPGPRKLWTVVPQCRCSKRRHPEVLSCYAGADKQFRVENEFECPCDVCDRLWFKNNIKKCQMNVSPFWLKGLVRDRIP